MNGTQIFLVILVAILAGLAAVSFVRSRSRAGDLRELREGMQKLVEAQIQGVTSQLGQLSQSMNQQLIEVRRAVQTGVADSGKLASAAQQQVAQQLQSSAEAVRKMSQQIGEMQEGGRQLSEASRTLQQVLGGAKSRGTLGEVALERLLEDALPHSAYEKQFRFSTGAIVDAIVRNGERILSVDSKFPLEAYRRLMDEGEEARKEFAQAVRKHADSIGEKYILPSEGTLDYALMFVPSEGVYYELVMTDDAKAGKLDEYCRSKRVFPVSPNTFYACLGAIALGLRGQKIAENAQHLLDGLTGLKKQIETFAEVYEKLGTHLRHAQQSYEDADSKLQKATNALEQMAQGALSEAAPKIIEPAAKAGTSLLQD